jgi:hypothetical protein
MAITSRALAFASRWFDEATVRRVFEPLIADWQRQWSEAPASRRSLVALYGFSAFACAVIVSSPVIFKTAPPPAVVGRVIACIAWFVTVIAILLAIPFITESRTLWQAVPQILLTLLPSGIVLALPFSMLMAVDVIRRERGLAPHVARATALKLAIGAVGFMVICHGFVMPEANQQFRLMMVRARHPAVASWPRSLRPPMRGLRERSTLDLLTDPIRQEPAGPYTSAGPIRRELSNRAVLALMPAIFVWLRWIAHDVRRPRRFWPLPIAAMLIVAVIGFFSSYWTGLLAESAWNLKPGTGYWLPIVIATLIGVARQLIASRREPSIGAA